MAPSPSPSPAPAPAPPSGGTEPPKEKLPPPLPTGWTRCHAYMERKRRFCRQQQIVASAVATDGMDSAPRYCGNHQHLLPAETQDNDDANANGNSSSRKRRRVPCPVDPSHSIYEDAVERHIAVCPKTQAIKATTQQTFYRHACNTGGSGSLGSTVDGERMETIEWAEKMALVILQVHQFLFTQERLERHELVCLSAVQIAAAVPLTDLAGPELEPLAESVAAYRIKTGGHRHLHQQASLVGHLRRIRALGDTESPDDSTCSSSKTFLEVGAGRGMMGLVAAGVHAACATCTDNDKSSSATAKTRLVLVERAGSRGKADTVLRQAANSTGTDYMKLKDLDWTRIQCDLAHVHVDAILTGQQETHNDKNADNNNDARKVVVIAKHLCGAGTDLALKSLEPIKDQVSACVMATCCHGVCSWKEYVGRDYLRQAMKDGTPSVDFGQAEFELLRRWSSGTVQNVGIPSAVVSTDKDEEADEHNTAAQRDKDTNGSTTDQTNAIGITAVVEALQLQCGVQGLGRACQRLIDYGRREYLQQVIFRKSDKQGNAELVYYVAPDITPQNAALIAHW